MMIKPNGTVYPISARYVEKWGTQFSVPQMHKGMNGENVMDGFIMLVAAGEYPFERGDGVKVTKINGVLLKKAHNGQPYYSVYADIELIKETYRMKKGKRDVARLEKDLPDELL